MFIKAIGVRFLEGVTIELTFIDGSIYRYDLSKMFDKYPQLKALEDRRLFESGCIDPGGYGVVWNDELDFDAESVYECGQRVGHIETTLIEQLGYEISKARENAGLTQVELAKLTGIDQGDISKLERGQGNPSFKKVSRILDGLNAMLEIKIVGLPSKESEEALNKNKDSRDKK